MEWLPVQTLHPWCRSPPRFSTRTPSVLLEPDLGSVITSHGFSYHCYADNSQLFLSVPPSDTQIATHISKCLSDMKSKSPLHRLQRTLAWYCHSVVLQNCSLQYLQDPALPHTWSSTDHHSPRLLMISPGWTPSLHNPQTLTTSINNSTLHCLAYCIFLDVGNALRMAPLLTSAIMLLCVAIMKLVLLTLQLWMLDSILIFMHHSDILLFLSTNVLVVNCKLLWIKASAKCSGCKCKCKPTQNWKYGCLNSMKTPPCWRS